MACNCGKSAASFYVVDGQGRCLIPDGVGGCRKFRSETLAAAEAERRGLDAYGISKGTYK